ncbi:thiolase family protein [Nocardioides endophyticus]|uniref:Thiolase family protein n=1 Tax=Nocardioides endophyticus TaxID=1353775 RepID=A0ABP8ZC33_9ACTN
MPEIVPAVIVDVVRTPSGRGKPGGGLSGEHPADLLAVTLRALVERTGIDPVLVDDVITGCVSQAGDQAVNIGRTALLAAGYPESVPATTIDRQCGSSQQALHFAAQGVMTGAYDVVVACGIESMSRLPLGFAARDGAPFAPLARRYPDGLVGQGVSAEIIAGRWKLDRSELDEFAARSHQLAAATAAAGGFDDELVQAGTLTADETVRAGTTAEGLGALRASFRDDALGERYPEIGWHITPGNSSPLTDGASAALVMSEHKARELGLTPRARFGGFSVTGSDPLLMLTGVIPATQRVLSRAGLEVDDIDAFEVNEAFAPVPLVWAQELAVDLAKVNPRGGAIALGHPMGASGTRILATLLNHLESIGGGRGLITMCEGGGMANATIIETV